MRHEDIDDHQIRVGDGAVIPSTDTTFVRG
jgi:hypothetical protein